MRDLTAKTMLFALLVALVSFSVPAFADDSQMVNSELSQLKDKVAELERSLRSVEGRVGQSSVTPTMVSNSSKQGGLLHMAEDVNMGGHLDVQWNNNFGQPRTASGARTAAGAQTNVVRTFDRSDGTFSVNASEIFFEKKAEGAGAAGFRTDIQFGEDAFVVNGDGDGNAVDLQQAYVEYNAPLSMFEGNTILPDQINIKAGRFATLAGLEVIEAPDNWNISRSLLFNYASPFAHTGIRTNFGLFNNFFNTYLGLNNGWDNPIDNNSVKTLEAGLGYKPLNGLSIMHALYWGGENNGTAGGKRFLVTNTASYDVTDKLAIATEVDFGTQRGAIDLVDVTGAGSRTNVNWYGLAGYGKYKLTDKFAMAYRAEIYHDGSSYRTAGIASSIFEQTLTADYHLTDDLIARAEFRHDKANDQSIFATGAEAASQSTIGAQMIYVI